MQNKPDNPPAFPLPSSHGVMGDYLQPDSWGMSLRDYFAAAALQGIIAKGHYAMPVEDGLTDAVTKRAYEYADEMLKAREPKQTPSTEA